MNIRKDVLTSLIGLGVITVLGLGLIFKNQSHEPKFTAEQKAVIDALNNAHNKVEDSLDELRKTKEQISQILIEFQASAVRKGLDTNVVTWWVLNGNGTWAISNNKLVLWGLRSDGMVTWKAQPQ